ncbi:hypothetical protein [Paenibacillus sp. BK720]|uniref:glucuronyl esterase domain-containing protein n=1 Tax=Paenibacillus sp. BK720 TaxID=2587092 RepID=UPI0014247A6A|nr:hypothetical protein [Paenibacillus sp. BK720]NIK71251.1 endo-1,4-beta-xylanase [Paenibacillus sp. BK720]
MSNRLTHYPSPTDLPLAKELPDPFVFQDGRRVKTPADWEERSRELQDLFHYYMYGYMPDTAGEQVRYEKTEQGLRVDVTRGDARGSFMARISFPPADCDITGPYPVIFTIGSLEGWQPDGQAATNHAEQANQRGYAVVTLLPQEIASDDAERTGAFFTLYPYAPAPDQNDVGIFIALGWAAGKVLDAFEQQLYPGIDVSRAAVTGFSRWGKASLVAGMTDKRFALVNPHASGAGGMASFRYSFEGKAYPWGIAGRSEPLEALQSEGEAHWFNSVFRQFSDPAALPFDQHELAALIAPRALLLTCGYSDDWINPEGMYVSYAEAEKVYRFLGAEDQIGIAYRQGGHNRTQEDIDHLLDYCDWRLRGVPPVYSDYKSCLYEPWERRGE